VAVCRRLVRVGAGSADPPGRDRSDPQRGTVSALRKKKKVLLMIAPAFADAQEALGETRPHGFELRLPFI